MDKKDTFRCAMCHGTFQKGRTDEEAEEQLAKDFPGVKSEECGMVCEDCYLMLVMGK